MRADRNDTMPNRPTEVGPCDEGRTRGMTGQSGPVEAGTYEEGMVYREGEGGTPFPRRKSLRNANINYRAGWWAVTVQVAKNKSLLGAIVGDKVVLNELGQAVEAYWRGLPAKDPELEIFTFTSAQEREALRRALAKGKRLIAVFPQGIPPENELSPELLASCRAGRALLLSPQPSGSSLNKKIATWCNEYVLRHADEIWVGDISPNGMLAAMLRGLHVSGKEDSNHAH